MSRYTVDKVVIDALVTAAVRWSDETPGGVSYHWYFGSRRVEAASAAAIGQMLWHANWYAADGWVKDSEWAKHQVEDVPEEPVYEYEHCLESRPPWLFFV